MKLEKIVLLAGITTASSFLNTVPLPAAKTVSLRSQPFLPVAPKASKRWSAPPPSESAAA